VHATSAPSGKVKPGLVRELGLFDATMIVMGGIVGSGIFINPYVVARQVHTPALILGAWIFGGAIAIAGAFIWAELVATLPEAGGQYVYLREAYHPALGFLYGWVLLLVIETGGMAAVTITFTRYFLELTGMQLPEWLVGVAAISVLTLINCMGVKTGGRTQSVLMGMKIVCIASLVIIGLALARHTIGMRAQEPPSLASFGAAMIPVLFAYGGWQTANFVAAEVKNPGRNLPRALVIGVAGVILLYVTVNWVCLRALGVEGLAATTTPASAVMRLALGGRGAALISAAIAISTLGFLSQSILTAPRVYFAMAEDGLFFRGVARVDPHTHVPILAIVVQSVWAMVIAMSGRYEQILNYVVSMDFLFFALTASTLFVFRRRRETMQGTATFRVPGHPITTAIFVAICCWIVANTIYRYPQNTLIGVSVLVTGIPVYWLWSRKTRDAGRDQRTE